MIFIVFVYTVYVYDLGRITHYQKSVPITFSQESCKTLFKGSNFRLRQIRLSTRVGHLQWRDLTVFLFIRAF